MGLVTKNELECDRCGESFELDGSVALAVIVEHSGDKGLLDAIAKVSEMLVERCELIEENKWLKRRIAEEDARLANV